MRSLRIAAIEVGCPSPTQVCVAGTVRGKHGFNATTVFVLGSRGEPPATAPTYRPVSGTITHTFKDGSTLTALETSIDNVDTTTRQWPRRRHRPLRRCHRLHLPQPALGDRPLRHRDPRRGLPREELTAQAALTPFVDLECGYIDGGCWRVDL